VRLKRKNVQQSSIPLNNLFALILLATVLVTAIIASSPTASKYVLDTIQTELSFVSGNMGLRLESVGNISGTTKQYEELTAGVVLPSGATFTYQWQRANSRTGVFIDIPGANQEKYTLVFDDNNRYIRVAAKGTGDYINTIYSAEAGPVVVAATPITGIANIVGEPITGQTLFAGALTPSVATATYQWKIADSMNGDYSNISSAATNSLSLTESMVDKFVRVYATGSNTYSNTVYAELGPIRSSKTPITSIGAIMGTTTIGTTLTAGTVTPLGSTVTYQWQRSDLSGSIYTDILGANSPTYVPDDEPAELNDLNRHLRVVATATGEYSGSVTSVRSGRVVAAAAGISLQSIGTIVGSAQVGQTVTAGVLEPVGATASYQWYQSEDGNEPWNLISGAANQTYTIAPDDVGDYLKVIAVGSGSYSGSKESDAHGPIAPRSLQSIGNISGSAVEGRTITAGSVLPAGATVVYSWQRATSPNGPYSNLGVTTSTYDLTATDVNKYVRVSVSGTGAYTGTVNSSYVVPVSDTEPLTSLTSIADSIGITQVFQTLTAGTVSPYGASVTYQWTRSETLNGSYLPINGATAKTLVLTGADKGYFFKVIATGSGSYTGSVTSRFAGPIATAPLTAIGTISGTASVTSVLTAGAVTPADATVIYQWLISDTNGENYLPIAGATSDIYVVSNDDIGRFIKVQVTGTNLYSGIRLSTFSGPVLAQPVEVTAIGAINGYPQIGQTIQAGVTNPIGATVTYQWKRADFAVGPYTSISGATTSSYTTTYQDLNKHLILTVYGAGTYYTNIGGVSSPPFGPIVTRPITSISNVIGKAQVGQVLTAGTVLPVGAEVNYQWQYYNGTTYVNIVGETSNTYMISTDVNNRFIRVSVTGKNGYSDTLYSNNTGPVGSPNAISSISDITGVTRVGQTLSAGVVLPHGSTISYQWLRSAEVDGTYEAIVGATYSQYTLTENDQAKYMKVIATGFGTYFGEVISSPTDFISKGIISQVLAPQGQTIVNQTLVAGSITPVGASVSYQWQRNDGSGFQDIPSATLNSYLLTTTDEGKTIRLVVTGTGSYEGSYESPATNIISASGTTLIALNSITNTTGTATVGQNLTIGSVDPGAATYTVQWQRSDSAGTNYTNIPGATSSTYTLTAADYNFYVRPVVTGTGIYTDTKTGSNLLVTGRQSIVSVGNITGSTNVGGTVTSGPVVPEGANVTYQWRRHKYSPLLGWQIETIDDANSYYYTTTEDDQDHFIDVIVSAASGSAYSGGATSQKFGEINSSPYKVVAIADITGSTRVGSLLTAGNTTPYGASITYQWLRKSPGAETYSEIPGATSKTYLLQASDYNSILKVVATGSGGYTGWVESAPTSQIQPSNLSSISSIVGTTVVSQSLHAGTVIPLGATVNYQWLKSNTSGTDFVEVSGATKAAITLTEDDLNCSFKVQVTGVGAYTGSRLSDSVGPVVESSAIELTSIGAFTGTLRVNSPLTVNKDTLSPAGAQATIQWQRGVEEDGPFQDIPGATETSYTLTVDDYLQYIRVKAVGAGAYSKEVYSGVQGPIQPCIITGIGEWSGSLRIGQSLVAGVPIPADATVSYKWEINIAILGWTDTGITTNSVLIPEKLGLLNWKTVNRQIRVTITGTGAYSGSQQKTIGYILEEEPVNPLTSIGAIQGTTSPGQTLTAGTVLPLGATVTYQWQRAMNPQDTFENIAGATNNQYMVQESDLGMYFKVVATGSGSYSGTVTSSVKGPVVGFGEAIPILAISDILYTTKASNITLTAGVVTPLGAEVTYQWYKSNTTIPTGEYTAIEGATSNAYTFADSEAEDYYFKVEVTGSESYSGTIMSNYTGPVTLSPTALTHVDIGGIIQVGETLTAANLLPEGATATYQWQVFTAADGVYADIPGATSSSYALQPNQYNYYMKVIATGSGAYTGQVSAQTDTVVIGLIESPVISMAAPVVGATPQTTSQVEGVNSSVDFVVTNVVWNEPMTPLGKFNTDTSYSATVTMESKNMKTFVPSFAPIVSGSSSISDITVSDTGVVGNTVEFTVNYDATEPLKVSSLTILSQPTKLSYTEGSDDVLDLSGLEFTELYNDGSTATVSFASGTPAGYETSPMNGSALTGDNHLYEVSITHTDSNVTIGTAPLSVEAPPKATNVSILGELVKGETLTGYYVYSDVNGDEVDTDSTYYEWIVDSVSVSSGAGSSYLTYLLTAANAGKTVFFKVTPVAERGTLTGSVVSSAESLPVATSALSAATVNMTTPVVGATPENSGDVETLTSDPNFTVSSLSWSPALTTGGKYAADTAYTATITLTSKNGTAFSATPFRPSIVGASTISNTVRSGNGAGNTVTFLAEFPATVALQLVSIEATTQPSKLVYKEMTEILSLVGLVITETYNDGSTVVVEFIDGVAIGFNASPANGSTLTAALHNGQPVTITHDATLQTTETATLTVTEQHAPVASNVSISGTLRVGQRLDGSYEYSDDDLDGEGATSYQWYADDEAIPGATSTTYTLTTNERGKTIRFQVTPVASAGITPGSAVLSSPTTTILQTIDIAAISGITAPSWKNTPDSTVNETDQYIATIAWLSPPTLRNDGTFRRDAIYTAVITLVPKAGYTLTGISEDFFTVNGADATTNTADSGVVTATFPRTN
jgi:hypothetical protein